MRENKFTPLLEWKFYSNLIKTHPCQVFPIRRGNVLSHSAMGPQLPEQSKDSKDSQMTRTEAAECRVRAQLCRGASLLLPTPGPRSASCCLGDWASHLASLTLVSASVKIGSYLTGLRWAYMKDKVDYIVNLCYSYVNILEIKKVNSFPGIYIPTLLILHVMTSLMSFLLCL